jgi:hypothetical protein
VEYDEYLAGLGEEALTALLRARADVLIEPAPRGLAQLAQRLCSASSLVLALQRLNRDQLTVGQASALNLMDLLDPVRARDVVAELRALGLVWGEDGALRLPQRLVDHWSAEIECRSAASIAPAMRVEDLRRVGQALGVPVDGLRKPELVKAVVAAMADLPRIREIITALPDGARELLEQMSTGYVYMSSAPAVLMDSGLLLQRYNQPEVPREVALACLVADWDLNLTGRPPLAPAPSAAADVRTAAQAAAQEAIDTVTALLDRATLKPISALKKGGVGTRERTKIATALGVGPDAVALWIDVTYAAGLLGETDAGYAPTGEYPEWRSADPNRRWFDLATAWLALDHTPTNRMVDDDREQPPPLPLLSAAGMMRRALLRESVGASVSAVVEELDWFCPAHGYPDEERDVKLAAILRESALFGVIDSDVLTELGECLIAGRTPELLSDRAGTVILQSDLTAVVAGPPSPAAVRLLAAAAVNETRGAAAVWRFTAASVRSALDAGWRADEVLRELAAISDRPVPQPLEYLVNDVARRHGHVRVRAVQCCVTADEATVAEILHTRSLAKLGLRRLAPTVLSSSDSPAQVIALLRKSGFAPVAEDADGTVVIERGDGHQAPSAVVREKNTLTAEELAARLIAEPHVTVVHGPTYHTLNRHNGQLSEVELQLLAEAIDNHDDVVIGYRDRNRNVTVRRITPEQLYDGWLDSWCHLREDERQFAVAGIESVEAAW